MCKSKKVKRPLEKRTLSELLQEACVLVDHFIDRCHYEGDYDHKEMSQELEHWWEIQKRQDKIKLGKIREQVLAKLKPIEKRALGL